MTLPTHEETATWDDHTYFDFEAVNASSLKELVKSPKQYVHRKAHPKPKTLNMVLGSAQAARSSPRASRRLPELSPRRQAGTRCSLSCSDTRAPRSSARLSGRASSAPARRSSTCCTTARSTVSSSST